MSTPETFATNRYTVSFASTNLSTSPLNLFPFLSGDTHCIIESIEIGVVSTAPTQISNFAVKVYRGSTTPVSTASVVTPTPVRGWAGHAAADCTVSAPTTNLPSTASAALLYAITSDDHGLHLDTAGFGISPGQRLDVVGTAFPNGNVYGTMVFSVRGNHGF